LRERLDEPVDPASVETGVPSVEDGSLLLDGDGSSLLDDDDGSLLLDDEDDPASDEADALPFDPEVDDMLLPLV